MEREGEGERVVVESGIGPMTAGCWTRAQVVISARAQLRKEKSGLCSLVALRYTAYKGKK
jgi:hypothetical protein